MQESSVLELTRCECVLLIRIFLLHFSFRGGRRNRQEEGRDRKKGKRTKRKDRSRKKGPAGCRKVGYWSGHVVIVLGGHVTLNWPFGQRVHQGCSLVKLMHP